MDYFYKLTDYQKVRSDHKIEIIDLIPDSGIPKTGEAFVDAHNNYVSPDEFSCSDEDEYEPYATEYTFRNRRIGYVMESVGVGQLKLDDGSSASVSKENAKLLNQMLKDLNTTNRKKMEKVMMKDKAGFEEILSFAREAL